MAFTHLKFNIALKIGLPKTKFIFQPLFFRGYVKLRGSKTNQQKMDHPRITTPNPGLAYISLIWGKSGHHSHETGHGAHAPWQGNFMERETWRGVPGMYTTED